jgi:hypothetical protein
MCRGALRNSRPCTVRSPPSAHRYATLRGRAAMCGSTARPARGDKPAATREQRWAVVLTELADRFEQAEPASVDGLRHAWIERWVAVKVVGLL